MSRIRRIVFLMVTLVLCVILFCVKLTGGVWHAVAGVLLIVVTVAHLCVHGKKLRGRKGLVYTADIVLLVSFVLLAVTGFLMHPLGGILAVAIVHKLSAVVFCIGLIGHVMQHRRKNVS
ncbi:MAG: hypothetical protein ACI4AD_07060 [Roseburia sp.]